MVTSQLSLSLAEALAAKRRELGIPYPVLAQRSEVSEPTLKRMFAGGLERASFAHVAAVARALGMPLGFEPIDTDEFRERVAREKAERLVALVQGTSVLEAQGVDDDHVRRMVQQTVHELLAGPPRRLWAS